MTTISRHLKLNLNDILLIEGDVNYSRIHYVDQSTELVCFTLKALEERLNEHAHFLRIHKGYLVNTAHIKGIFTKERYMLLKDRKVPISRRRVVEFRSFTASRRKV